MTLKKFFLLAVFLGLFFGVHFFADYAVRHFVNNLTVYCNKTPFTVQAQDSRFTFLTGRLVLNTVTLASPEYTLTMQAEASLRPAALPEILGLTHSKTLSIASLHCDSITLRGKIPFEHVFVKKATIDNLTLSRNATSLDQSLSFDALSLKSVSFSDEERTVISLQSLDIVKNEKNFDFSLSNIQSKFFASSCEKIYYTLSKESLQQFITLYQKITADEKITDLSFLKNIDSSFAAENIYFAYNDIHFFLEKAQHTVTSSLKSEFTVSLFSVDFPMNIEYIIPKTLDFSFSHFLESGKSNDITSLFHLSEKHFGELDIKFTTQGFSLADFLCTSFFAKYKDRKGVAYLAANYPDKTITIPFFLRKYHDELTRFINNPGTLYILSEKSAIRPDDFFSFPFAVKVDPGQMTLEEQIDTLIF